MKTTTTQLTVNEAVRLAKTTGVIIDNVDLIKVLNYINEYEVLTSYTLKYNEPKVGKTTIFKNFIQKDYQQDLTGNNPAVQN